MQAHSDQRAREEQAALTLDARTNLKVGLCCGSVRSGFHAQLGATKIAVRQSNPSSFRETASGETDSDPRLPGTGGDASEDSLHACTPPRLREGRPRRSSRPSSMRERRSIIETHLEINRIEFERTDRPFLLQLCMVLSTHSLARSLALPLPRPASSSHGDAFSRAPSAAPPTRRPWQSRCDGGGDSCMGSIAQRFFDCTAVPWIHLKARHAKRSDKSYIITNRDPLDRSLAG